jgi:membrane-bound serine protease (ClpP class)
MVEVMRASEIPIVVYVAPRGALAASAGTVITVAGHAAAMAPDTVIGAASPVGGQGEDLGETLSAKIKESLKATVRSLMEGRPPQAIALADAAVEDASAASASEALEAGLVDFIAQDTADLLRQLDGFEVETPAGWQVLTTAGAVAVPLPLSPLEQILVILTNPNIVFLLLTVGVQAVLIELGSPGGWVPGFIGVVALSLATYGLGVLPVNLFGLIFLGTAFVLFALEVKAPTKGALSLAGVASFVVGALVLFNTARTPGFPGVSIPLVLVTALLTAGLIILVISFAIRAQQRPIRTGQESLVGLRGVARSQLAPRGSVQVAGELWTAELNSGEQLIEAGTKIEVVAVDGVHLLVQRVRPS